MTRLAILCSGPSLELVRPEHLAEHDYVMAVNFAVLHEPTRPLIDVWAFQDPLERAERLAGAELLSIPDLRPAGRPGPLALLPELEAIGECRWPMLAGWTRARLEIERSVVEIHADGIPALWSIKTTIMAVLWAARRDFDRIDLYGCDMTGWGSPLTPWMPYVEANDRDSDGDLVENPRWGEERRILEAVMRKYPKVRKCLVPLAEPPPPG